MTAWNGHQLNAITRKAVTPQIRRNRRRFDILLAKLSAVPVLFMTVFGNQSYAGFVSDREPKAEKAGDLIKISAPPAPWKNINVAVSGITFWSAPKQGSMPAIIEWWVSKNGQTVKSNEIINHLEEVEPGLWLPMDSQLKFFVEDPTSEQFGNCCAIFDITVDRKRSSSTCRSPTTHSMSSFPLGLPSSTKLDASSTSSGKRMTRRQLSGRKRRGRLPFSVREQCLCLGEF